MFFTNSSMFLNEIKIISHNDIFYKTTSNLFFLIFLYRNLETTDKQVLNEDMTKMVKDMQEQATYNKLQNDRFKR